MDKLFKGDRIKSTTTGEIYEVVNVEGDDLEVVLIWSTMNDALGETKKWSYNHVIKSPFWKKSYDVQADIKTKDDFISPEQIINKINDTPETKTDKLSVINTAIDWTFGYPFRVKKIQDGTDRRKNWRYIATIDTILNNAVIVNITVNGFVRDSSGEVHAYNPEYKMKLNKTLYEELIDDIPAFYDKYIAKDKS